MLATVILIAVTLVIAVALVGWVMGLWGSLGRTEMLKPVAISFKSNGELTLMISNEGTVKAKISRIDVEGVDECKVQKVDGQQQEEATVDVGKTVTIVCKVDDTSKLTIGGLYTVKVITTSGNVYPTQVRLTE